jgi:hypothetical protein
MWISGPKMEGALDVVHAQIAERERKANEILDSVQLGKCNADPCGCVVVIHVNDAFCPETFRAMPKELRKDLRDARDAWLWAPGIRKAQAYTAYAMRIVGARLWLKQQEAKP